MSSLAISLRDEDFLKARGMMVFAEEISEDERINTVRMALPDLIASKIQQAVPTGFEMTQITFEGEISGKPLGIGVSGKVSVVFEKPKGTVVKP